MFLFSFVFSNQPGHELDDLKHLDVANPLWILLQFTADVTFNKEHMKAGVQPGGRAYAKHVQGPGFHSQRCEEINEQK